jgi:signal transduction histidine kinase
MTTTARNLLILGASAATKRMPGGKIVVRTCTDAINAPVCEIVDTGIGIESRDLPNIFDRFFRAENARLTSEVGSGLGLAIAQWIVDVHEARLSVEKCPRGGLDISREVSHAG